MKIIRINAMWCLGCLSMHKVWKEIEKNLHCRVLKNEICFFDEIDSTNLEAIRRAEQGLVIVADKQNAGRG